MAHQGRPFGDVGGREEAEKKKASSGGEVGGRGGRGRDRWRAVLAHPRSQFKNGRAYSAPRPLPPLPASSTGRPKHPVAPGTTAGTHREGGGNGGKVPPSPSRPAPLAWGDCRWSSRERAELREMPRSADGPPHTTATFRTPGCLVATAAWARSGAGADGGAPEGGATDEARGRALLPT